MGSKASNFFQSDRPESGGADKDDIREENGLLEREKQKYATEKAEEAEHRTPPSKYPGEKKPGE